MITPVPQDSVRILLEIDVADQSITGRAGEVHGASREFAGWLGLLSTLEALLDDPESDKPDRDAPD